MRWVRFNVPLTTNPGQNQSGLSVADELVVFS